MEWIPFVMFSFRNPSTMEYSLMMIWLVWQLLQLSSQQTNYMIINLKNKIKFIKRVLQLTLRSSAIMMMIMIMAITMFLTAVVVVIFCLILAKLILIILIKLSRAVQRTHIHTHPLIYIYNLTHISDEMLFSSSGNFARQADIYIHHLRFLSHCDNNHPYPHPQHLKHQGRCAMCPLLSYHILSLERAGGWLTFLCYIFCPYNSICGGYVCVCE